MIIDCVVPVILKAIYICGLTSSIICWVSESRMECCEGQHIAARHSRKRCSDIFNVDEQSFSDRQHIFPSNGVSRFMIEFSNGNAICMSYWEANARKKTKDNAPCCTQYMFQFHSPSSVVYEKNGKWTIQKWRDNNNVHMFHNTQYWNTIVSTWMIISFNKWLIIIVTTYYQWLNRMRVVTDHGY